MIPEDYYECNIDNICYICNENINYYKKSNCGCKIYIHLECYNKYIKNYNICMICKKIYVDEINNIIPFDVWYNKFLLFFNYLLMVFLRIVVLLPLILINHYLLYLVQFFNI
jgi:hypothetical protein